MKFLKYNQYKASNIEWIGAIPAHWEIQRIKNIFHLERGKFTHRPRNDERMYDNGTYPFIQTGDIACNNKYVNDYKQTLNEEGIKVSKKFNKGTLAMTIAANIGDVAILGFDAYFPDSIVAFKTKQNTDYLFYQLITTKAELNKVKITNTQDNLNLERLNSLLKVLPPIEEQKSIAQFLDKETTLIDKKISLLETKINHYKDFSKSLINQVVCHGLNKNVRLKDSRIEWIGKIPEHWEIKRFKEVCYKNHTGGTPQTTNRNSFDGDNIWITIADIDESRYIGNNSKLKLTAEAIKESNIPITPKGSLLYSFKLTLGKIAFASENVYTNEAIISILPNKKIDLNYCYYMLPIFLLLNSSENIYGAKMLNQKQIANALLIVPPFNEQQEISTYLDYKTRNIEAIIKNITEQLDKLKELRKTLINDVVTGKIKLVNERIRLTR